MPSSRRTMRASSEGIIPSRAWFAMPPERTCTRPPASRSASIFSSRTWAITLRQVLAWQTSRTLFTASPVLPGPLPEARTIAEVLTLALWALVERPPEVRAGRFVKARAEGLGQELDELLGLEPAVGVDPADRLRLGQERVAVAEGVEDLPVDVRRGVAREEDAERRHVVRVALGADGLLARPLARLLEDLLASRSGVDHAGGAARHDGVGGDVVLRHGVGGGPGQADDAGLGRGVVGLAGRAERRDGRHADDASG